MLQSNGFLHLPGPSRLTIDLNTGDPGLLQTPAGVEIRLPGLEWPLLLSGDTLTLRAGALCWAVELGDGQGERLILALKA